MLSEKQLSTKLKKVELKNKVLGEKNKSQSKELARLRSRNKELQLSRDKWKAKLYSHRKSSLKKSVESSCPIFGGPRARGHRYPLSLVTLCIRLYMLCGCSLRGVVLILKLIYPSEQIPSKSTILNWLQKSGYYAYNLSEKVTYPMGYSLIIDESMVIGQERMMMAFILGAQKLCQGALRLWDVSVAKIAVKPSWNSEQLQEFLTAIFVKLGSKARYVICDGDSKNKRALRELGMTRIQDVGHEIGRILERTYKKADDFKAFTDQVSMLRFKEIMKPTAYLLPPKARTNSRFMNISHQLKWAHKILTNWHRLSDEEQDLLSFLQSSKPLIKELSISFELINPILKIIKNQGLSRDTLLQIYPALRAYRSQTQNQRTISVIDQIRAYLWIEVNKIPQPNITYHASSDIMESAFGKFKFRKSPNFLHGVTASVLLLPLATRINTQNKKINLNLKDALEAVRLKDIKLWADSELIPNQVTRRNKLLKNEQHFST